MDINEQEDGVLLLLSTPGGLLTYNDHDIVMCMEASKDPGRAVVANEGGHWSFVYITDKKCAQTLDLMRSQTTGEGEDEVMVAKRKFCCVLPEARAEVCLTYRTLDEAPELQKMTCAEFQNVFLVDKDA
jgi:hypothetical protein